ncbi:hypothetical protein COCOBI_01-6810 [Coccomyxa sp. Obi]|nr:hypothetical protein COCOBI_01-6810 [Coccomyxa sp. Obi]
MLNHSLAGDGGSGRLRSFLHTLRMPANGARCQQWCADRDEPSSHAATLDHCISQCVSHPEVMGFLPDLRTTAAVPHPVQNRTILFGAFYAEGDGGSEGHDTDHLAKPDISFISALRRSHPGCSIAVLTDQSTQIELPADVRLFRFPIDRSRLGRNSYANYYQYLAQIGFLQQLIREGSGNSTDVVFLDMDILVVDSLTEVFAEGAPFDYGVTLSDAVDMPINMGMQFVQRGHLPRAISFLQDVVAIYPFNETFTAGQVALANALGVMKDEGQVLRRVKATVQQGSSSKLVGGCHSVRFLPCMRYNYCHCAQSCCTDPTRLPFSLTTAHELSDARVKVLHFVGHRKKALQLVHRAFMVGGRDAAYKVLSMLPHTEQDFASLDMPALERSLFPQLSTNVANVAVATRH